ncbi:MAG: hypothetical protein AB7S38_07010 [Vulcanimicrobiota bacterium]
MKIFVSTHRPSGQALELAAPSDRSFRIYAAFEPEGEAVAPELAGLLRSALAYPPALAQARNDLDEVPAEDYLVALAGSLTRHLDQQDQQRTFLARAQHTTEELTRGRYYWVVGFDTESGLLEWVSDDFLVYEERPEIFGLKSDDFTARFSSP